ncbi:glycoside hydrolase family 65 protein [Caldicellulosiruptoraceae bacterium PP1]
MNLSSEQWLISDEKFEIGGKNETIFALTNGYLGIRGTHEEIYQEEIPGTYIAGVFDKDTAQVTELVNLPNIVGLRVYINREFLNPIKCEILEYKRVLDMKQGILYKKLRLKDKLGRVTNIENYRFLSLTDKNIFVQKYKIIPENYSAILNIENIIDASTYNLKENPNEKVRHYKINKIHDYKRGIYVEVNTKDKDIGIGIASSITTYDEKNNEVSFNRYTKNLDFQITENKEIDAKQGFEYFIYKITSVVSTRECSHSDLFKRCESILEYANNNGIDYLFNRHVDYLSKLWEVADIQIVGDEKADKALRFNIFNLSCLVNPEDQLVSLGAKGLHGEGYKGHVFWDTEIFMLPFYIFTNPKAARSLLMYRYNLLNAARENAKINSFKGAQYPWESADTGKEETPKWGIDYLGQPVRIWTGDIEYHITADIAYAVNEYWRVTGDIEFMKNYGSEIIIETARFWISRLEHNKEKDRYEINDVIGPDEFHEHCNNNAYTNYLAKWNIEKAIELYNTLKKEYPEDFIRVSNKIGINQEEINEWQKIKDKIYFPYDNETKLIEQFEGYFSLKDIIIDKFDQNDMPVWPDSVNLQRLNDYQLIKQADVIMLLHLFSDRFDENTKKINFDYYEKRTMHKSSLSPSMYALMGLVVGSTKKAYQNFMRTCLVDLEDNQGNSREGLHAASAGGTWQTIIFGFGGLSINNNILCINPWIPEHWEKLIYKIYWKGNLLQIEAEKNTVNVVKLKGDSNLEIKVKDKIINI